MSGEKEACFCYGVSVDPITNTNMFETRIEIESVNFVTQDFYTDLSILLKKHIELKINQK